MKFNNASKFYVERKMLFFYTARVIKNKQNL